MPTEDKQYYKKRNFEELIRPNDPNKSNHAEDNEYPIWGKSDHRKQSDSTYRKRKTDDNILLINRDMVIQNLQQNQQGSILIEYYKILFKRKWLIALCSAAIVIPALIWLLNVTPIYETEAAIIYEEASDTAFLLDFGQPFYSKSAILNMVEQIKSRTLANEVVKSLPEEIVKTFKIPRRRGGNFSKEKFIAEMINKNLSVENVRGADIIRIRIQTNDPVAAKIVANTYVDLIIAWNMQKKTKEISNIRAFVEGQLSVFQEKLKKAEEELLDFKENNKLVTLSDASSKMVASLTDEEVIYNKAKTEREALEQRRRFIEQKKQELMPALVVTNSAISQKLKDELLEVEKQYAKYQLEQRPQDPETMAMLREKIKKAKRDLINDLMKNSARENLADPLSQFRNLLQESLTLEVDLETHKAREQGLKNTLDEHNQELQLLPKQELALARLVRAREVNDKLYATLLEKREEARITEAGKVGDVQVIDYADAPEHPIKPKKKKTLALALMLGLSFGVGLVLILNSLDNSLKTDQDVEKHLDLPVIASIPKISNNGRHHKIIKKEEGNALYQSKLLSQIMTQPHIFEAYRLLQLNFSFLNPDKPLTSILITSSEPGAGKTLTSLNIAQFYAREGTKTLVMDCDLRRPMVHTALKIKQEPGLTNALIDKSVELTTFTQIVDDTIFNGNLAILTCGTLPPNPSELLGSKRMEDLIAEANKHFDLVILDAPPIISVTDSIILGQIVDGVVMVLRSCKTSCDAAVRAKKILENSKINLVGTILNDIDLKSTYGYYKDYYYYSNSKTEETVAG